MSTTLHSLPLPPPGFDALPLQAWQQTLLEERLTAHHETPDEARPWAEVIERVQQRLR